MRAEAQSYINRIEAALALVRLSLDWERALRRLQELNARVQDPALWDYPKQAQAISRAMGELTASWISKPILMSMDSFGRKEKLWRRIRFGPLWTA